MAVTNSVPIVEQQPPPDPANTRASDRNRGQPRAEWVVLLSAIAFGLGTGVLEVIVLAFRKLVEGDIIARSQHFVWMAPLFYVVFFTVVAAPLVLLTRWWPQRGLHTALFTFPFIAALSSLILLAYNRLHSIALVLLALGVAYQALRTYKRHPVAFERVIRRGTAIMLLVVSVLGATVATVRVARERLGVAGLPAAHAGAPNVLFIILDTVRAASLSLYGYSRATSPMLEAFARRGVVFDRAIAPSPWTLPSHASLFTGEPPHALDADWLEPLDRDVRTLAEAFQENGYDTGGFVANLIYGTWETGLNRGFLRYSDYQISPSQIVMNASLGRFIAGRWSLRELIGSDDVLGRKNAALINGQFLDWVGDTRDRPFFAFLNYYDAHDPYLPPDDYYRAIAGHERSNRLSPLRRIPIPERRAGVSDEALRIEMDSYDASLAYLDRQLGNLFAELERRGMLENTLVVVTADHGEEFGEHGLWYHGSSLYLPALHVPLIVSMPGRVPAGVRVAQTVSLVDIAATVSALALPAEKFPGTPLSAIWDPQATGAASAISTVRKGVRLPEWYPIAQNGLASVVVDGKHYIRDASGREELYDITTDPWEKRNLLGVEGAEPWVRRLQQMLPASTLQPAER